MIISFDIDNTLIPYLDEFEVEARTTLSKLFGGEPIRRGTIQLFQELETRGHSIWIYTTSFRSPFNLRKTFRCYGLNPSRIINEKINQKVLKRDHCRSSKNPKLFGIDIHIDDSRGVEIEGKRYGFDTIIIETSDKDWVSTVLEQINEIEKSRITKNVSL